MGHDRVLVDQRLPHLLGGRRRAAYISRRYLQAAALVASILFLTSAASWAASEPPDATLVARAGRQRSDPWQYCWPQPKGPGICADPGPLTGAAAYLPVERGEIVRFVIPVTPAPDKVVASIYRPRVFPDGQRPSPGSAEAQAVLVGRVRLKASGRPRWRVLLPPGRYVVLLQANWGDNDGIFEPGDRDATWDFGVGVQPGRRLPVTGPSPLPASLGIIPLALAAFLMTTLMKETRRWSILRRSPAPWAGQNLRNLDRHSNPLRARPKL